MRRASVNYDANVAFPGKRAHHLFCCDSVLGWLAMARSHIAVSLFLMLFCVSRLAAVSSHQTGKELRDLCREFETCAGRGQSRRGECSTCRYLPRVY